MKRVPKVLWILFGLLLANGCNEPPRYQYHQYPAYCSPSYGYGRPVASPYYCTPAPVCCTPAASYSQSCTGTNPVTPSAASTRPTLPATPATTVQQAAPNYGR